MNKRPNVITCDKTQTTPCVSSLKGETEEEGDGEIKAKETAKETRRLNKTLFVGDVFRKKKGLSFYF